MAFSVFIERECVNCGLRRERSKDPIRVTVICFVMKTEGAIAFVSFDRTELSE